MNIRNVIRAIFAKNNGQHLVHPNYRPDIDGLRAIAVLAVVCFHLFPSLLKSGFVGVDIFFVISGFLISTILIESLNRQYFSFKKFYSQRIRRIFPALIVVLLASLITGWFILFQDEYRQLNKHILGAAGFVSNIVLWHENSYFDNASSTKPLLHLWSLAIEEQFYILWPFIVYLIYKLRLNFLTLTLLVALISFTFNIIGIYRDVSATFYSPFTRFWELLVGAALAQLSLKKYAYADWIRQKVYDGLELVGLTQSKNNGELLRNVQSILGMALIIVSIFCADKKSFPGWWALLPTLGTALLIGAGSAAGLNRTILAQRPLIWIGLISYPLYLWHWPLLSFTEIYYAGFPPRMERIAILALSLLLAWATYRFVEPVRYKTGWLYTSALIASLAMVAVVASIHSRAGIPAQQVNLEKLYSDHSTYLPSLKSVSRGGRNIKPDDCNFYNPDAPGDYIVRAPRESIADACYTRNMRYSKSVLIWGDSHAQMLLNGLKNNLPDDWQILQVASDSCRPSFDPKANIQRWCPRSNSFAIEVLKKAKPDVVIVAHVSGHDLIESKIIADKLAYIGIKKIVFTGPAPQWEADLPRIVMRRLPEIKPERTFVGILSWLPEKNETLKREFAENRMIYVDIFGTFCNVEGCLLRFGNQLISYDASHLSYAASDYLASHALAPAVVGD